MKLKYLILGAWFALGFQAQAALQVKEAAGWQESAYMEFTGIDKDSKYNGYLSTNGGSDWTKLDAELIRSYGTYGRVDAVGLAAGNNYKLKVVPVAADGSEIVAEALTSEALTVVNYKRAGFAHTGAYAPTGNKGVGAYNNDGTLKANAKVFYVTAQNAKTISTTVTGATTNPCVGLQNIITGYEKGQDQTPIAFRIIGTLSPSDLDAIGSSAEGLQVKGRKADSELNITIEGIGNDAMLRFGILVRNTASLEIRNLGIATTMDDDVSLDTDNDHVWIHNLDVFYGPNKGGDQKKGDGAIDIKSDSKHVTVASNHFWDTGKSSMCGMKDESGPNYITYHDNWFDHSDSRHARVRTMSVHMYNNYFDGVAKYGAGATSGASIFMENNNFRNCKKPMLISLQGSDVHMGVGTSDETKGTFSGEQGGIIKAFGNSYNGTYTLVSYQTNNTHFDCWEAPSRDAQVPAEVKSLSGSHTYNNFDTDASVMYAYTPAAAADVPANVTGRLGAGRINHGDLQYTFTNADDALDEVNTALRSAIDNYKSSLVAIVGYGSTTPEISQPGEDDKPNKDDEDDDNPSNGFEGTEVCHFTDKAPSLSMVSVSGNYSNSKGTVTYNDKTYNICVKMETATDITITPTADCTITLIFGGETAAGGKKIKLDDVSKTLDAKGQISFEAKAKQTVHLKKGDSINLFLIVFKASSSSDLDAIAVQPVKHKSNKVISNKQLHIQYKGSEYDSYGRKLK